MTGLNAVYAALKQLIGAGLLCVLGLMPLSASAGASTVREQINHAGAAPSFAAMASIWQHLQQLPATELVQLNRGDNTYFEQGWVELALQFRMAPAVQRDSVLLRWRQQWFHHPAVAWLPRLEDDNPPPLIAMPERVERLGVLLPLSGVFATQGQAVLDGMRSALAWDRRQGYAVPELQVFDSATLTQELPQFVAEVAREYRLDMLIGPMRASLSRHLDRPLPVPVLALNRVGGQGFNGLQLDLASDQELRQLVQQLRIDGHRRVLLLAPAGEAWVDPLLIWIEQEARLQQVRIIDRLRYSTEPDRLEHQLAVLLGVQASQTRGQRMRSLLDTDVMLVSRARRDVDAVLLIAQPEAGRLVKPMLNYHGIAELPVYAGSHLFSGENDPQRDRDLEGITFCDMPWRLYPRSGHPTPSRFFALGMDAGSVYRALTPMQAGVAGYFEGETGNLRLQGGRRLQRELVCARFLQGVPEPLRSD